MVQAIHKITRITGRDIPFNKLVMSPQNVRSESGKCGDIRAIWRSLSKNKSPITASFSEAVNHISS
ncbi:hypothetical protein [Agrobacterium sp. NPDC089420]|uniref:hypothetical protein n=1 Tax=Agrobacterium sp. NPDC089420 TaxID=3363918 RepID=UPI00384EE7D8